MLALTTPYKNRKHPGSFKTMTEVKAANRRIDHHWFDPDAMRFFDTRIETGVIKGKYFITSEQYHHFPCSGQGCFNPQGLCYPRRYTIRIAYADGSVDTIGDFQQFATKREARKTINRLP